MPTFDESNTCACSRVVPLPMQLYVMNPNKLFALDYLLQKHRHDKVIVFSDDVFALWKYATMFKCMAISGKVCSIAL